MSQTCQVCGLLVGDMNADVLAHVEWHQRIEERFDTINEALAILTDGLVWEDDDEPVVDVPTGGLL